MLGLYWQCCLSSLWIGVAEQSEIFLQRLAGVSTLLIRRQANLSACSSTCVSVLGAVSFKQKVGSCSWLICLIYCLVLRILIWEKSVLRNDYCFRLSWEKTLIDWYSCVQTPCALEIRGLLNLIASQSAPNLLIAAAKVLCLLRWSEMTLHMNDGSSYDFFLFF